MTNSIRNNWDRNEIIKIYEQPFNDLIFQAQTIHRQYFKANSIQLSTLFSLKTGSCSQDCKYCAQSAHYKTDLKKERLVEMEKVLDAAEVAFANGASRFCMGAAWKNPASKDMPYLIEIIKKVKSLGLQTCMTLGKLNEQQCQQLADAGLDYYNHNVNTSREYHDQIVTTHSYDDRLETLGHVRESGMKVCCGGIVGMGEKKSDRFSLLKQLANMLPHPDSVPINMLIKIKGTPLDNVDDLDWNEFIRTIATARILMPKSYIRLSAGRESMNEQMQSLAFLAGANSIFYGSKLLTTENNQMSSDNALLGKLKIQIEHDCLLNSD